MSKVRWKPGRGKTWREKLEREHPAHGRLVPVPPGGWGGGQEGQSMLIPRPIDVDAAMRRVRKGRITTMSQIRVGLARAAKADLACPLTSGIFMRIAAEAAEEDRRAGKTRVTPWWRTVRDDGSLHNKFPGGTRLQASRLRGEGFKISRKGKRVLVADFQSRLIRP